MLKGLLDIVGFGSERKEMLEVVSVPVEVPVRAVANIDPRLFVKTGKRGKTVFMKSPCVGECAGCDKQFKPVPYEGQTYCLKYSVPKAMWTGLNSNGLLKTCLVQSKPKPDEKDPNFKLNPLKASKRGVSQSSVPSATGSKEAKGKKKVERRDSR